MPNRHTVVDESRGSYTGVQALPVLPQHFHIIPFNLYSRYMDNTPILTRKSSGTTPSVGMEKNDLLESSTTDIKERQLLLSLLLAKELPWV